VKPEPIEATPDDLRRMAQLWHRLSFALWPEWPLPSDMEGRLLALAARIERGAA
jgi:hypothetical protein